MKTETDRQLIQARQVALCQALGLDPARTTNVRVDFTTSGAVVSWEGSRKLTRDELERALDAVASAVVAGDDSAVCGDHDRPRPCIECGPDDASWSDRDG